MGCKRNHAFAAGDGVSFPVVAGCTEFTLTEEQVKQKVVCRV